MFTGVGDGVREAYTAVHVGCVLSHEIDKFAEAETVISVEGNMCGTIMQGAVALPGSGTTSRWKGTRRNLGDLTPPAVAPAIPGHGGKS